MTTIPLVHDPADTTGLTFTKVDYGQGGLWYARYTKDGTRRRKSLRTPDMQAALKARDKFYAELVAAGATVSGPGGRPQSPDRVCQRQQVAERKAARQKEKDRLLRVKAAAKAVAQLRHEVREILVGKMKLLAGMPPPKLRKLKDHLETSIK